MKPPSQRPPTEPKTQLSTVRTAPFTNSCIVLCLLLLGFAGITSAAAQQPSSNAAFNSFSNFITKTPYLERFQFEEQGVHDPVTLQFKNEYHALKLQDDAFMYWKTSNAEHLDKANSTNILRACGYYGDTYWHYTPGGGLHLYVRTLESVESDFDRTNTAYVNCMSVLLQVQRILNLGLPYTGKLPDRYIGYDSRRGMAWQGDDILITNTFPALEIWSGKLKTDARGTPREVAFQAKAGTESQNRRILYSYDSNPGNTLVLPSLIEHSVHLNDKWVSLSRHRLIDVRTIANRLPHQSFHYENLLSVSGVYHHTNQSLVFAGPDGFIPVKSTPARRSPSLFKRVGIPVLLALAFLIPLIVFLAVQRKRKDV